MAEEYRVIRAPLGLTGLWDHLAGDPSLAGKVQLLEIQRQTRGWSLPLVPAQFQPASNMILKKWPTS